MESELEFISTKDLLDELTKRYDSFVFVGQTPMLEGQRVNSRRINWKGDSDTCLSLLSQATYDINVAIRERDEEGVDRLDG